MSRLNDALKRASQTDRSRQSPSPTRARMAPAADRRGKPVALALGIGGILALGLTVLFFWRFWTASHPAALANVEPVLVVTPKSAPQPFIRAETPPPATVAVPPPLSASRPAPVLLPDPIVPAQPVEPAWPANLKLTGIFFRKTNPLALISGKTVGEGDEIDGIRVTKIENDRVTVEWNGKVKELVVNSGAH